MNKALASIFLSLIMLTGVTAGSVAFAEDETDEETEEEIEIEVEIEDGVAKIKVEINDEELEFEIEWVDEQTTIEEIALQTDLTIDQISSVISFEIESEDDDNNDTTQSKKEEKLAKAQEKRDEKIAEAQEKRDEKLAKAEEKRTEKQAKATEKLAKAQERFTEKIAELETKLTEKAQLSEERANKILEKITKETQKHDDRVLKLVDKFQSGKYFGENKNTDKETKSFIITFEGTAAEISDKANTEALTGELFLENLLTGSHSKKFRVTGGTIFVAEDTDNAEVFDVVFGKARLSSSGQGGQKDSMIIIAQVSDGVDVRTLKLSIDLTEEFTSETESAGIDILFPRSKIASLWFLSGAGTLKLTVDEPPVDDTTPVPDETTPDDTPPDDIPQTIGLTVTASQDSYVTGDEIVISGTVDEIVEDLPIVLQIVTATDLVGIAQIIPESDGSFAHTILADGPLWLVDNTITVKAFYGGNNVAQTTFEFSVE